MILDSAPMWVFGYGSLMFDGWQKEWNSLRHRRADLHGHRRAFNKKSVESRGTPDAPGLTLNLERCPDAICHGMAFEFEDGVNRKALLDHLQRREACKPTILPVTLLGESQAVDSHVYIYTGKNLLPASVPMEDRVAMIRKAQGIRGTAFDYVKDTYEGLKKVGVDDPAVTGLWEALTRRA